MVKTPPANSVTDTYTAVIFVHGMGPQTRHENLGQLLEAFETLYDDNGGAALRNFESRTEPSRVGDADDVPFSAFDYLEKRGSTRARPRAWAPPKCFRAYEAYWSPVTARGAEPWRVATWALGQLAKPEEIAARSWRASTRLRIARLHVLFAEDPPPAPKMEASKRQYLKATLLSVIHRFRGADGGRFEKAAPTRAMDTEAFSDFAAEKVDKDWSASVRETISLWDQSRLPIEKLASGLAKHVPLVAAAGLYLTAQLLGQVLRSGGSDGLAVIGLAAAVLTLCGLAVGASRFLADTFADVFIWNSNQDRDLEFQRRRQILDNTRRLFEHVATDDKCERLVIVAHSLGTAITLETLSLMGRRKMARAQGEAFAGLNKLSHLFTLGSPIDKIFYFFHTREGGSYRAGRLFDDLRGDLSQEPFFKDDVAQLRWLNIWDRIDIVSDPLFTPLGNLVDGARLRSAQIENHAVENTTDLDPVESHIRYLSNLDVVRSVAAAVFENKTAAPKAVETSGRADTAVPMRAARRMIPFLPAALLAGAILVGLGGTGAGLVVAIAPILVAFAEVVVVMAAGWGLQCWTAFKPVRTRAILKVRLLVAAPRGD